MGKGDHSQRKETKKPKKDGNKQDRKNQKKKSQIPGCQNKKICQYKETNRRVEKWLTRLAHNQKIVGSNPTSATIYCSLKV